MTIPHHLGIILDGNRRWAKERGLPAFQGHRKGLERIKEAVDWAKEKGVKVLTLFVFSTENWERPKREVKFLMALAQKIASDNLEKFHNEGVRVKIIGQKEVLPRALLERIKKAEEKTKDNKEMTLNFALSYGGRAEIVEAIKSIIDKKIPLEGINEDTIKKNLWTSDVDLIIRTGKEQRISNFLIWQAAYSELYFSPKYWPDFTKEDFEAAIEEYSRRKRRFGK